MKQSSYVVDVLRDQGTQKKCKLSVLLQEIQSSEHRN